MTAAGDFVQSDRVEWVCRFPLWKRPGLAQGRSINSTPPASHTCGHSPTAYPVTGRIENSSSPCSPASYTLIPQLSNYSFRHPHPTIVLETETTFPQFRNGLINLTSRNCTTSIRRYWQSTTLTALCQRLHHTHPRSAACAICAAQIHNPAVRSGRRR